MKKHQVNEAPEKPKKSKKERILRGVGIALCILALLFLIALGAYHAILEHYLGKINIVTKEEEMSFVTQKITEEEIPESVTETLEETFEGTKNESDLPLICDTKDVKNVLLMATDTRVPGGAGRSDVMMLVSINKQTGKIVLCSFLRDLYAHYPAEPANPINGGYDKLNHAHAYGGAELTMAVLKETFNLDVKHFAKVDFFDYVKVVDALGGVDLYLTADEAAMINQMEQAVLREISLGGYTPAPLSVQEGMHHLTGVQALCHARNRTLGSDWARTQRQRAIIEAMIQKAKGLSLSQIDSLLNTVLPLVTTNMPKEELKSMVSSLPVMVGYEIESTKIPQEGTYTSYYYNMVPDLKTNCDYLYRLIYAKEP